ncbi:MAG TPA: hypothetical protein GX506_01005 [Firmicutes bacterium]|nr:hypothetical protein [Bacillota bacterium]
MGAEEEEQSLPLLPFDGDIVCRRDSSGEPQFNIPQRIKHHSPTGMEWGYGGSGPADFALNILALFVDEETAFKLHQSFKWHFVAPLPETGGIIKRADIIAWLNAHGIEGVA